MVDVRHPPHHLFSTKLPQGLKVKVPKALMPAPPIIIALSCKAKGLHHLGMEDVEVIAPPTHLGEKMATSVPDGNSPCSISTRNPLSSSYPKLMIEFCSARM